LRNGIFAFLATVKDEAFPISYLVLSNVITGGSKIAALTEWFLQLRQQGVDLDFIFPDLEQSEIAAAKAVWSSVKIQLWWWHMERAVEKRPGSKKDPDYDSFNFTAFQFKCAKYDVISALVDKRTSIKISILQSHQAFLVRFESVDEWKGFFELKKLFHRKMNR
jgi:hypothetical protein